MILVKEIDTKSIVTKSKLPDADFVINPYLGCPHKCMYCYAEFMKRFSNHKEPWGDFLDIKPTKTINTKRLEGKKVLISSVTDPYNGLERKYKRTQHVLNELLDSNVIVDILTKSNLVCRDIELFKKIKELTVGISMNTLDEEFRKDIEPYASSIDKRIAALRMLKENNIKTYAFIGPIFPEITNVKKIIEKIAPIVDFICFENLNLRGKYKERVLGYIDKKYPNKKELYKDIYEKKKMNYWKHLENEIGILCNEKNIESRIYFYHEKIKK